MGGNALKHIQTVRLNADEFKILESEVVEKLKGIFGNSRRIKPTLYYRNKPDFGDLDVLIEYPLLPREEMKDVLHSEFGSSDYYFNSNVISFDYKKFQVDLIFTQKPLFNTSFFYYSYNDLNNLVGRIAHKFGVKFGHMGLDYPLRDSKGQMMARIELSRDCERIYDFLGFDYTRWEQGFDDLEDIFNFVVSSKYFTPTPFYYQNLNHQNRTRNKKRKNYRAFLEYLDKNDLLENEGYGFYSTKRAYIEKINEYFPDANIYEEIAKAQIENEIRDEIKSKVNGSIMMEITELKGKELGAFIGEFKAHIVSKHKNYRDWALKSDDLQIHTEIQDFFNNEYRD